jgi:hypothetical protein
MGDNEPYVWRTTDFGETWVSLSEGLPGSGTPRGHTLHTIVEDPVNPGLLFLGTEFGVYMSLDGGGSWDAFMDGLPPVAVRDLIIHPRDGDLVAGTHGRSIWIVDDITPLRQLTAETRALSVHVFRGPMATQWLDRTNYSNRGSLEYRGENPEPGAHISFWLAQVPGEPVTVEVMDPVTGRTRSMEVRGRQGVNRAYWDYSWDDPAPELEAYRASLVEMLEEIEGRIRETRDTALLRTHRLDFLAHGRSPNLLPGHEYSNEADARTLLLDHLRAVGEELVAASNARDLNSMREQLLAFSPFVGDAAFFGFYGGQMTSKMAKPGRYLVRITVAGETAEGSLEVRADPIRSGADLAGLTGSEMY